MAYPTTIDTLKGDWNSYEQPIGHANHHNEMANILMALQNKIGTDASAVPTSMDYLLQRSVRNFGNENIGGIKTFLLSPILPTPTTGLQGATKDYADASANFWKYFIVRSISNYIVNNSFETDLSGWSTYGSATNTRVTSQFFNGVASMQVVTTGSSQGTSIFVSGLITGQQYVFSCYVKGNVGGENFNIYIDTTANPSTTWTLTNGWVRYSQAFIATSGGHTIYPRNMGGLPTTFFLDGVQLEGGRADPTAFTTTQGNLTVEIRCHNANFPTPIDPIKWQDRNGLIRYITSGITIPNTQWNGGNRMNSQSAELNTFAIDYFVYFGWDSQAGTTRLLMSRFPYGNVVGDFSATYTNEKYLHDYLAHSMLSIDSVVNIGRITLVNSGSGWSLPTSLSLATVKNNYIIDSQWLDWNAQWTAGGSMNVSAISKIGAKYKISGDSLSLNSKHSMTTGGTAHSEIYATLPFSVNLNNSYQILGTGLHYDGTEYATKLRVPNFGANQAASLRVDNANFTLGASREINMFANYRI